MSEYSSPSLKKRETATTIEDCHHSCKDNEEDDFDDLRGAVLDPKKFIQEMEAAKLEAKQLGDLPLSEPRLERRTKSCHGRLDIIC